MERLGALLCSLGRRSEARPLMAELLSAKHKALAVPAADTAVGNRDPGASPTAADAAVEGAQLAVAARDTLWCLEIGGAMEVQDEPRQRRGRVLFARGCLEQLPATISPDSVVPTSTSSYGHIDAEGGAAEVQRSTTTNAEVATVDTALRAGAGADAEVDRQRTPSESVDHAAAVAAKWEADRIKNAVDASDASVGAGRDQWEWVQSPSGPSLSLVAAAAAAAATKQLRGGGSGFCLADEVREVLLLEPDARLSGGLLRRGTVRRAVAPLSPTSNGPPD
jgi:hypothetical protein